MKTQVVIILISALLLQFSSSFSQTCRDFEFSYDVTKVLPNCTGGDGELLFENGFGGVPPYSFEINGFKTNTGAFFDLDTGQFEVLVLDARGCRDTIYEDLQYDDIKEIIRPFNAFTPNGDGLNDSWIIRGIQEFRAAEVRVFNRWGQQVYLNSNYNNKEGWDGTNNGAKLPASTYYYVISVISFCVNESIAGTVTIVK